MAEERTPAPDAGQAEEREPAPAAPKPAKKRRRSKFTWFLWLLLLGIGGAVGLHLSGVWDGRPLFWNVVPRIPYAGPALAEFFEVPREYTLTVGERRALELREWQRRLDERERSLDSRSASLDVLSSDLAARLAEVALRQESLDAASRDVANGTEATPAEKELIKQISRTYQDMSARNAAAVVEHLRDPLAVELLMTLPNEARASIMGKMNPQKAARLTELMSRPQP